MGDGIFFLNSECITLTVELGAYAYYEGGPERRFELLKNFQHDLTVLNSIV
jgi:hypothetical protein